MRAHIQLQAVAIAAALAIALLSSHTQPAYGHEGGHHAVDQAPQAWLLSDGSHLHGTYISADDQFLNLLQDDGSVQSIEIARLAGKHRLWIARQRLEIQHLNTSATIRLVSLVDPQADDANARHGRQSPIRFGH